MQKKTGAHESLATSKSSSLDTKLPPYLVVQIQPAVRRQASLGNAVLRSVFQGIVQDTESVGSCISRDVKKEIFRLSQEIFKLGDSMQPNNREMVVKRV